MSELQLELPLEVEEKELTNKELIILFRKSEFVNYQLFLTHYYNNIQRNE